jgi:hypothetical protein
MALASLGSRLAGAAPTCLRAGLRIGLSVEAPLDFAIAYRALLARR